MLWFFGIARAMSRLISAAIPVVSGALSAKTIARLCRTLTVEG
jgi:hypothetical protein